MGGGGGWVTIPIMWSNQLELTVHESDILGFFILALISSPGDETFIGGRLFCV